MESMNFGLDELHKVQLGLLDKVLEVCGRYGYEYFLAFGSLLGAVRDHKVIPWDDSIDIVLPWSDYTALKDLPEKEWGEDFFFQTYETDPQYPKYYAKLRDNRTTLIKSGYLDCDMNHGIYINLMPLIHLADDAGRRHQQLKDIQLYRSIVEGKPLKDEGLYMQTISSAMLQFSGEAKRVRMREELIRKILCSETEETKECIALAGVLSSGLPLKREWFREAVDWEFEGRTVRIPKGWREWLTLRYGNYMETPVSDLQGDKISGFVTLNTRKPYTDYKGKTYCVK